jgi:glycosyltransferase involved in cell wall biosynthesis
MKIFFPIGAFYPSQIGGPCNTIYWHARALSKKGMQVNICTSTLGIDRDVVPENVKLHTDYGTVFYGSGNYNTPSIAKIAVSEVEYADIVHLNSFFDLLSISTFFYSTLFHSKTKVVWSVRGQLNPNALKFGRIKKIPLLFLYRLFSDRILFHTSSPAESCDTLSVFKKARVVELPNFIEPANRLYLGKKKQLLFVGRIHPIKAIDKLLEALYLSKLFITSDYTLVVAGIHEPRHQYYMDELNGLIVKFGLVGRVEFRGHVKGIDKEYLYAESQCLILPSETENFGEALNQGTPVIASKGTPWKILEEYGCGFHVENSPESLSVAIDKMLSLSSKEYEIMNAICYRLVEQEFDITSNINRWIDVYNELVLTRDRL